MRMAMLLRLVGAVVVVFLAFGSGHAQSLIPGTVHTPLTGPFTCPSGFVGAAQCYSSYITCPEVANVPQIDFYYGVVPAKGTQKGTVVFFNGGDGNGIGFSQYVPVYVNNGYQTIQVEWGTTSIDEPWEELGPPLTTPWSIKTAACRPAGLLAFLFQTYEYDQTTMKPTGAMCAQGTSAGGAAIAYSLADYGSGSYLDNAELVSGPPLSDIARGCDGSFADVTVCPGTTCNTGGEGGWLDSPKYNDANGAIDGWTGISTTNPNACTAGTGYSSNWTNMSIIYSPGAPTFSYPQTGMSGWLCSNQGVVTCGPNGCVPCTGNDCQNNSAIEGQFFYSKVTSPLTVYRVDGCNGPEGVDVGTVPGLSETGLVAIQNDMVGNGSSTPAQCIMRHN